MRLALVCNARVVNVSPDGTDQLEFHPFIVRSISFHLCNTKNVWQMRNMHLKTVCYHGAIERVQGSVEL